VLLALAWRNLWRQPRRTLLSLFSIAFAATLLVFMLSFQLGVYSEMKETVLRMFDGYAQFQAEGYATDPDLRRTIANPEGVSEEALGVKGIAAASPRINAFALLANGSKSFGAAVVGVDPARERGVSTLPSSVRQGRYLEAGDNDGVVLGDALARNLDVGVGQKVTLLGSGLDGSVAADVLRVTGIYHTGIPEIDRTMAQIPLSRAQATFAFGDRANTIALSGASLSDVQGAQGALEKISQRHGIALQDWGALEPALRDSITLKYITSSLFYITLVTVVTFIILNTLLMSVLERTREFGMLLAIGMRPSLIGAMVWLELITLAVTGGAIGIAIGASLSLWFERTGISFAGFSAVLAQYGLPTQLYPALSVFSALVGPSAIVLAICIGGIVPYLHVRRLTPALAMRAA
jgi:ABC-type lipoprotein release transport system permease subunit